MDLCAASGRGSACGGPGHRAVSVSKDGGPLARRLTENPGGTTPITELARQASYTVPHFSRVFKHHIGVSPKAFLLECRVDAARQWLIESDLTVKQIARRSGFEDLAYFSRLFKAKTTIEPIGVPQWSRSQKHP